MLELRPLMSTRIRLSLITTFTLLSSVVSSLPHISHTRRRVQSARYNASESAASASSDDVDLVPEFVPLRQLRPARRDRFNSALTSPTTAGISTPQDEAFLAPVPVNAAGFRCEDSALVEAAGAKCSLLAKSFGPLGCQRVLSDLAAERGKSLEGVPAAFRNRRVADACPESCGLCELCAPGCARWFIGNGWCEPECNVKACQWDGGDCWETDCVVGPWGEYSKCSIACDPHAPHGKGGFQTRTRSIKTKNSAGGKPCPPLEDKKYGCNAHVACPVECEVSEWSDWSQCSTECGVGESTRTRKVVRPPANGALHCPELKQKRPCFLKECDSPCQVSEWTDWSDCSQTCGGGTQVRQRSILQSPVGTNSSCPILYEERDCNMHECPRSMSKCVFTEWSTWSECSKACGGGVMTRSRAIADKEMCTDVTEDLLEESRPCNTFDCESVAECILGEWDEWSDCSPSCGEGKQSRSRQIIQAPSQEADCDVMEQSRRCFVKACPNDCQVTAWSEWSTCSVTETQEGCGHGSRMRSRSIIAMPSTGGSLCPDLVEFEDCFVPCEERERCHFSDEKSPWSSCEDECQTSSRGHPKSRRHALIGYWTEQCMNVSQEESVDCEDNVCADITDDDCLVSDWSPWSPCSIACGGGTRSRTRQVIRPPTSNGRQCPPLTETESCGISFCPIDCKMGPWLSWSQCSAECGMGTKVRSRVITSTPVGEGALACGPVTQVAPCFGSDGVCAQDCLVSDWSEWSACSRLCGGGIKRRQRRITQQPVGKGASCPELEEVVSCNEEACAIDCVLGEWSDWGRCSAKCTYETGERFRYRDVTRPAMHGGKECIGPLEEREECFGSEICETTCNLGQWGPWSSCNASCGEGVMTREREIISIPANYTRDDCVVTQSVPCFVRACAVDCEVTEWTDFEECSAKCGGGEQKRTRDIITPAANGGLTCPPLWEIQKCNTTPCSTSNEVDCQMSPWTDWTKCTQECGGGVTTRTRSILRAAGPGGKQCGSLKETKGCNLQRCPDAVCMDNPRIESQGITCQILKTQGCVTNLMELAKNYGVELPPGIPPEARVQDACPMTCGVCQECAPGCELRDLGNTVCTPECNVEECDFDRGDCGGDCLIGELNELTVQPPVTALQGGQDVKVFCPAGQRFAGREALEHVNILCDGDPLSLLLAPTPQSIVPLDANPLESLKCHQDVCAYIRVDGFEGDLSLFNGFYSRDRPFEGQFPNFYRRSGRRFLSLSIHKGPRKDQVHWVFGEADPVHTPAAGLSATQLERVLPDIISGACEPPDVVGGDVQPNCSDVWFVELDDETTINLEENLQLTCYGEEEKDTFIMRRVKASTKTKIPTGPGTFMPSFCEDIKMVSQLSGYTCGQMQKALGCHLPLRDTGHSLPAFIPLDASVAFVCPETCDQCELCAPGCSLWFLGNNYCDPACNNPDCNFDEGDCEGTESAAEEPEERRLELESTCSDDPLVVEMGFSCETLVLASKALNGCETTLMALAEAVGVNVTFPPELPTTTRVLDACPATCDCCTCDRLVRDNFETTALMTTTEMTGPCSDSDIVYTYSKMTCAEITLLLTDCDVSLGVLGYLPEGVSDTILLSQLCPMSCGKCYNPNAPAYECHDLSVLQELSGFSCAQAVGLLGAATCEKALSSFGYAMPAAVPPETTLSALCAQTCNACRQPPLMITSNATTDSASISGSDATHCVDGDFVFDMTGFECSTLVESGALCFQKLTDLGYILPDGIPESATLSQACPRSCHSCPAVNPEGVCEDSKIVTTDLGTDCETLIDVDGCASLLSASAIIKLPSSTIGSDLRIGDLCRYSCGYCHSSSGSVCQDHPMVVSSGYTCALFLQFAPDGCQTQLQRLLGRGASLPKGVPSETLIQDACPKTCQLCSDVTNATNAASTATTLCDDSPLLNAVGLSCEQVINMAGGGGLGCLTDVASIAGSSPMAALLPEGMKIKDLCNKSCAVCGAQPTCSDGFQNGAEEGVDCGGSCRPCRVCPSSMLKALPEGMTTTAMAGDSVELFTHGSQRLVVCKAGYESSTNSTTTISCHDGTWSTPTTTCSETVIRVWKANIGVTHGDEFDYTILPPLQRAFATLMGLVYPEADVEMFRIVAGGSCTAMSRLLSEGNSDDTCEDNALVAQMGFGCSMLAGLGCDQSLAALAAMNGSPLPAGLPSDAKVSDACPKTCDACEEAQARIAEYLATTATGGSSLGTDCFKAIVVIEDREETSTLKENVLTVLGSVSTVNKLLTAAIRDSFGVYNTTISTTWSPALIPSPTRTTRSALTFIQERPVTFSFVAPDVSAAEAVTQLTASNSSVSSGDTEYVPFEQSSITLHEWNNAMSVADLSMARARRIFTSSGISPPLDFYLSKSQIQKNVKPALPKSFKEDSESQTELLNALVGRYVSLDGSSTKGTVLGADLLMLSAECSPDDDCCDLRTELQSYLDGPCGSMLYSSTPTADDLGAFCRVPESTPGEISCLSKGLTLVHKFRDRAAPTCYGAVTLLLQVLESWCDRDPWTGEFCLLNLDANLKALSLDDLLLKNATYLDGICHQHSCVRSNLRYLHAAISLDIGWSTFQSEDDTSAARRRRLASESHTTLARSLLEVSSSVGAMFRYPWYRLRPDTTERRRLLEQSSQALNERMLIPLDQLGEDLLSLVCLKINENYCQQTSQLLAFGNPIENPSLVEAPCASHCYTPVVEQLGEILQRQGNNLQSPWHSTLGVLLSHYGRFACLHNSRGQTCAAVSLEPQNFLYPVLFNASLPTISSSSCIDCEKSFINDGQCDAQCFTPTCAFDGTDCVAWNLFPETIARLLHTVCASSILDPCLPLHKDFDCSACKSQITRCLDQHGCCYGGALESLRIALQQQRQLMIQQWTHANSTDDKADLSIALWFDELDLDRSLKYIEYTCNLSLGRNCGTDTVHRASVLIKNFSGSPISSESTVTSRLLYPAFGPSDRRRLAVNGTEYEIDSFASYLKKPDTIAHLANRLHLLPSDFVKIETRDLSDNRTHLLMEFAAPLDDSRGKEIQEMIPDAILDLIRRLPIEIYKSSLYDPQAPLTVKVNFLISLDAYGSSTTVGKTKASERALTRGMLGLEGLDSDLPYTACTTASLMRFSYEGLFLSSTASIPAGASEVAHGSKITLSCGANYVSSDDTTRSVEAVCSDGVWLLSKDVTCEYPCTSNPLSALMLDGSRVTVVSLSDMQSKLWSPKEVEKQLYAIDNVKFPPQSSAVLSCVEGYSTNITALWGTALTKCERGAWSHVSLDCQPACPLAPSWMEDIEAYTMTNTEESRYGGQRAVSCATGFFATPPTWEGKTGHISCQRESEWSAPEFRCVAGLTTDPSGGPGTVTRMLKTLFSRTGIMSLCIFFACMVIVVIVIAIYWNLFYRSRADQAYQEHKKLLQEYLASTMTGGETSVETEHPYFPQSHEHNEAGVADIGSSEYEGWNGRSPSSSTVSAVRRVVLLAGTTATNVRPSDHGLGRGI